MAKLILAFILNHFYGILNDEGFYIFGFHWYDIKEKVEWVWVGEGGVSNGDFL